MDRNFQNWLASRNLDAQQWTPELRRSLKAQYRAETRSKDGESNDSSTRLIIDGRGCQWPARTYRV